MDSLDSNLLLPYASKYIWWKTPEEAITMPQRVIAQVMNIGDYDDVYALNAALGDDIFRETIHLAEAGQFSDKSWHYWHYRLGLAKLEEVPPLPVRSFS